MVTVVAPESVTVANLIIIFLAVEIAALLITKAVVEPLEIVIDSKPAIACCIKFKFVFVLVPHVPAFSPVAISSSLRSVENVEAMRVLYPFYAAISTSVQVLETPLLTSVQVLETPGSTLDHAVISGVLIAVVN